MVATIHRDPFHLLIRKIGYSVGLENTLARIRDVVLLYAKELSVSSGALTSLIHDKESGWGLATDNILDFFSELDLVRSEANAIFVLPTLDALAVLSLELEPSDFEEALKAITLFSILSADGDIFLNCLDVGFERDRVRDRLVEMIHEKRRFAKEAFGSGRASVKVDRFITIETQRSNRGGASAGQGVAALQRREPLRSERGPLAAETATEISVSDDYLRKVPGRRRDWARSLGLVEATDTLAGAGERLLELFSNLGQRASTAYTFWPYADELPQLKLQPENLPWRTPERQAVTYGLKEVMLGRPFGERPASTTETVEWLKHIFTRYRTLNPSRSIVRVELPVRVARLVALGFACARTGVDHDVLAAVLLEQSSDQRLEFRPSRQHEGSIVFRGN